MADFVHLHVRSEYSLLDGAARISEVVARAKADGVTRMICSGFDLTSSKIAKGLAEEYEDVYFCAGFHPSELKKYNEGDLDEIRALCMHEKCVAVGEIGLDYHFDDNPPKQTQLQE